MVEHWVVARGSSKALVSWVSNKMLLAEDFP